MWPEDKLVLSRTIRVNGRMTWLNSSIRGRMGERNIGAPYGIKCWIKENIELEIIIQNKDRSKQNDKVDVNQ